MGQACTTPMISPSCSIPTLAQEDELANDPNRQLIKQELSRSKADVLLELPGADVIIIDANGDEAPVASGRFHLVKLAPPSNLAFFFVGDSFEDLSEHAFYYPMLAETPVCLSNRHATKDASGSHVLTMNAGEGDVLGIRLPSPLIEGDEGDERLQALIELLNQHCTLQNAREPDYADKLVGHMLQGGKSLISSVEWMTEKMSAHIAKGGELVRSKISKAEEEVQVGPGTTIAVSGARFVAGGTVIIAGAVTDGLMDTALLLGEDLVRATQQNPEGEPGAASTEPDGKFVKVGKAAGVVGLQVCDSLMKAGDRLLDEACSETAAVVGHRYGKDACVAAREGLHIAKDVKAVADMFGKKAVKRLAAKGAMYTAKGMIDGQNAKQSSSQLLADKSNFLATRSASSKVAAQ